MRAFTKCDARFKPFAVGLRGSTRRRRQDRGKAPPDPSRFRWVLENVSEFVDRSFELLKVDEFRDNHDHAFLNFDIDEETLEIFRSEASELTNNIANSILALQMDPNDREALWEIRRNTHTFKGAAGIVGQRDASALAHRVEDLLDR